MKVWVFRFIVFFLVLFLIMPNLTLAQQNLGNPSLQELSGCIFQNQMNGSINVRASDSMDSDVIGVIPAGWYFEAIYYTGDYMKKTPVWWATAQGGFVSDTVTSHNSITDDISISCAFLQSESEYLITQAGISHGDLPQSCPIENWEVRYSHFYIGYYHNKYIEGWAEPFNDTSLYNQVDWESPKTSALSGDGLPFVLSDSQDIPYQIFNLVAPAFGLSGRIQIIKNDNGFYFANAKLSQAIGVIPKGEGYIDLETSPDVSAGIVDDTVYVQFAHDGLLSGNLDFQEVPLPDCVNH